MCVLIMVVLLKQNFTRPPFLNSRLVGVSLAVFHPPRASLLYPYYHYYYY